MGRLYPRINNSEDMRCQWAKTNNKFLGRRDSLEKWEGSETECDTVYLLGSEISVSVKICVLFRVIFKSVYRASLPTFQRSPQRRLRLCQVEAIGTTLNDEASS